jgi:hypothetical protein
MPYKDPKAQREATAKAGRRFRIYRAAVARGDPLALKAEEQLRFSKKPGEEALLLWDWIAALPTVEERKQHKAGYIALWRKCFAPGYAENAESEYERLKDEVIAAADKDEDIFS